MQPWPGAAAGGVDAAAASFHDGAVTTLGSVAMSKQEFHSRSAEPTVLKFRTRTGLRLVGDRWGSPERPTVILLHGGGQTRFAWGNTARSLAAAGYCALALDARGHGESEWAGAQGYRLEYFADDLEDVIAELGTRPAVVGASLGGMTAMLAVSRSHPAIADCVVLVDVTPHYEPEGVRRIVDFMRARPDGFVSLQEAAQCVAEFLPHRPPPSDTSGLAKNLRLGDDGRYRWHWDPDFIGRFDDPAASELPARLAEAARALSVPTLLVRGGLSEIVSEASVRNFLDLVPHCEYVDVAGAAHMVAGDRNDAFSEAVVEFLRRTVPCESATAGETGAGEGDASE